MTSAALPDDATVSAWTGLIRAQRIALGLVEQRLKAAGHPPLAWYDVLWELERAGAAGMRPFALEQALLLAQPNLSRLLDRLESRDLISRRPCESDGRGQVVSATPSGLALRREIWIVYRAAIQEAIGTHLDAAESRQLAGLLARLAQPIA